MQKKKIFSELKSIEDEVIQLEEKTEEASLREAINSMESRHDFHLGLAIGLIFAVAGGFFSIIAHEIFIQESSYAVKLIITKLSFLVLLLCLLLGIRETRINKELKMQVLSHMEKKSAKKN